MNTFKILLLSAALVASSQTFAQGIYFGPNDVGVESGVAHQHDYRLDGNLGRDRGFQEGRSVYRPDDRNHEGQEK